MIANQVSVLRCHLYEGGRVFVLHLCEVCGDLLQPGLLKLGRVLQLLALLDRALEGRGDALQLRLQKLHLGETDSQPKSCQ